MNEHFHDIFYDINKQSLSTIKSILKEAYESCYSWHVDILDSSSPRRKEIEMSFEDIMKKCTRRTHYVFIHRRGFTNWKWCLEVGFRSMTTPEYFLWINLEQEQKEKFIEKHNLKLLG